MQAHQQSTSGVVTRAMDLEQLKSQITLLTALKRRATPIASWYIDNDPRRDGPSASFNRRFRALRWVLDRQALDRREEAFEHVHRYLMNEVRPTTRGVAIFARAGTHPFFLGLQFQVPFPDRLSVNSTPDIHHLVEIKDTYHRYMSLISSQESARLLEGSAAGFGTPEPSQ